MSESSQFALSVIQKFPGKYDEIHFIRVVAHCVNGTFARQWHTFHHENELPLPTCSHYHNEERIPERILFTTQDHALLTEDFRALARLSEKHIESS